MDNEGVEGFMKNEFKFDSIRKKELEKRQYQEELTANELKFEREQLKRAVENFNDFVLPPRCGGFSKEIGDKKTVITQFWPSNPEEKVKLLKEGKLPVPISLLNPLPLSPHDINLLEVSSRNILYEKMMFRSLLELKDYIERHAEKLKSLQDSIREEVVQKSIEQLKGLKIESVKVVNELSLEEKVKQWIASNIPNSPNKGEYKKAFMIIANHPNPKEVTDQSLIREIEEKHSDLKIGSKSLEMKIPAFKNALPL